MPKYTFECETCNLRFTKNLKIGTYESHPCPECKEDAARVLDEFGVSFTRNHNSPPGNTGVSKHDYPTADMAVGPDADKRWSQYRRRNVVKNEVRKQGGTHKLIRTNGPGYVEYGAMTGEAAEGRRDVTRKAMKVLQSTKPQRQSLAELKEHAGSR